VIGVLVGASNIVKIAHLKPTDVNTVHEAEVLKMCLHDMKARSILPKDIDFEIFTMGWFLLPLFQLIPFAESCNRFSGVEFANLLHYKFNASVYFGPG
jgi:hypothetical protein